MYVYIYIHIYIYIYIYTNSPVNAIVRVPHSQRGDQPGPGKKYIYSNKMADNGDNIYWQNKKQVTFCDN